MNSTSERAERNAGIIPRVMVDIFQLTSSAEILSLSVFCSFLQMYNEHLYDMLRCDTAYLISALPCHPLLYRAVP